MTATKRALAYRVVANPEVRVAVANLGLACCSLEVEAAVRSGLLAPDQGSGDPVGVSILLVSGTVTQALAPAIEAALRSQPSGTRVVAFGACATSGGPYWDAPTVVAGVDSITPVARYVPGCPPRPEALVAALMEVVS